MDHADIQRIFDRFFVAAETLNPLQACTLCDGLKQVVEGHDCPRCDGTGVEPAAPGRADR